MTGSDKHRHEKTDLNLGLLVAFGVGLLAMMAIGILLMMGTFRFLAEWRAGADTQPPPLADTLPELPPEPRLQVNAAEDLTEVHREEDQILTGYAWVDRENKKVRIPLERALERVAEQGLPEWEPVLEEKTENTSPEESP